MFIFFVAYPFSSAVELALLTDLVCKRNVDVTVTIDCMSHALTIAEAFELSQLAIPSSARKQVSVSFDVDMSFRILGGKVHLGVRRSPLTSVDAVKRLCEQITNNQTTKQFLKVEGLMVEKKNIFC